MEQEILRNAVPVPDGKTYPRSGFYAGQEVYVIAMGTYNARICPIEGTHRKSFLVDPNKVTGVPRLQLSGEYGDVLAVQARGCLKARHHPTEQNNRACPRRRNMKFSKMCDYHGEAHFVCKTGTKNIRILAVGQPYERSFVVPIAHTSNRRPADFYENADLPPEALEESDSLELLPQ